MHVCPECFDAPGLQRRIKEVRPRLEWTPCDFHPRRKGVPIKMIAEIVDEVFRAHYAGGPDNIWGTTPGDDLSTVLSELVLADNDRIVNQLCEWLIDNDSYWPPDGEDAFYSDEYVYSSDEFALNEHGRLWEVFCRKLMHDARFFNEEAQRLLTRIFEGVHLQRTAGRLGPVYIVKPGDALARFYRARKADDEATQKKIRDDLVKELGPPPERLRRAGRLNAAGVSAFYGAFDLDYGGYETSPPI